jgi:hypothetical protein
MIKCVMAQLRGRGGSVRGLGGSDGGCGGSVTGTWWLC